MSKQQDDPKKWERAHTVLKQALMGAEAAAQNRALRVPKGMWTRGGGKPGKATAETTHFESAYRNFTKGRKRALAGGYLSAREHDSYWCRFGFYSTVGVLELLGDRVDTALIPADIEAASEPALVSMTTPASENTAPSRVQASKPRVELVPVGPKHGELGHKLKVGADAWVEVVGRPSVESLHYYQGKGRKQRDGEMAYETEEHAELDQIPSARSPEWLCTYWGGVCLGTAYSRADKATLKTLSVYDDILDTMIGNALAYDDEPSACPDDVHPKIREYWTECALGIRDAIEGTAPSNATPARKAGAAYARENDLRGAIEWNEAEQRFAFVPNEGAL